MQQRKSFVHCLPHTHSHAYTNTQTHIHERRSPLPFVTYSTLAYRKGSFFPFHSSLIFPPTCVAICLLMMQLEQHCQLPASDREREECSCAVHALLCTTPSNLSTPPSVLFFLRVSPCEQRVDCVQLFRSERSPTCEKMSVGGCACPGECPLSLFLPLPLPLPLVSLFPCSVVLSER